MVMDGGISSIAGFAISLVERLWPDPAKQKEEIRKLRELELKGERGQLQARVDVMLGQLEVNKTEAQHKSIFVAGWRPFVGWVAGAALAYQFVLYPLLLWLAAWLAPDIATPPEMEISVLISLVTGMLGLGVMRTFDKRNGTQTDSLRK